MAIRIDALRAAAMNAPRSIFQARVMRTKTAFLCHSHKDADLAKGLVNMLSETGWNIYIDWEDVSMPEAPDSQTAERIQQKIIDLDFFLFLATSNSMTSRWCPWEIGFADGRKAKDQILIVPTTDGSTTHGNEYLQLYRHVDKTLQGAIEVWQPGQRYSSVPIRNL